MRKYKNIKLVWWTPFWEWGYVYEEYDYRHHRFNVGLFCVCWNKK